MRINHNIAALNTHRQLNSATTAQGKSMEKLASGLRINKAGDDAAGLAISEKMRGQIRGLDMASKNAQDGISLIATAEGALNETHDILQRMRELAVQSGNDTNNDNDRGELQKEVDQLAQEITRIANNTEFNTKSLLNGAVASTGEKSATFQIGANSGQNLEISINAMDAKSLGISRDVNTTTGEGAGSVSSATIAEATGPQVKDGEVITLTYTAGSPAEAATNAIKTGDNAIAGPSVDFSGATKIKINGSADITLANVKLLGATHDASDAAGKAALKDALQLDINNALGTSNYVVGVATDGTLSISDTSKTGVNSEVDLTGSDVGTGATLLGFTTLTAVNGLDAIAEVSAKVTLTGTTSGAVQSVNVKATDTSFTVAAGDFKGVSANLSGAASTALASGTNTITLAVTPESATSASFSGGAKLADASTKAGINISTQSAADSAITVINKAIESVSCERSKLGAAQNRLEHTINNLSTSSENLTAAESRVRDVDMAKEMMEQTKNSILSQAAQAMLAQAQQTPQGVLQLLR